MEAFRRYLRRYLSSLDMSSFSLDESDREKLFAEIFELYFGARAIWMDKRIIQDRIDSTGSTDPESSDWSKRAHSPLVWWSTGWIETPTEHLKSVAAEELVEFAFRTLFVSPTATATERTFNLKNRIHTKQRANLSKERVRKILFCQWDSRVLRSAAERDEIDMK